MGNKGKRVVKREEGKGNGRGRGRKGECKRKRVGEDEW